MFGYECVDPLFILTPVHTLPHRACALSSQVSRRGPGGVGPAIEKIVVRPEQGELSDELPISEGASLADEIKSQLVAESISKAEQEAYLEDRFESEPTPETVEEIIEENCDPLSLFGEFEDEEKIEVGRIRDGIAKTSVIDLFLSMTGKAEEARMRKREETRESDHLPVRENLRGRTAKGVPAKRRIAVG